MNTFSCEYSKMIKLLISLLVTTLASHSVMAFLDKADFGEKLLELADMLHNLCMRQSGTDEATIQGVRLGNFPDDIKIKVYIIKKTSVFQILYFFLEIRGMSCCRNKRGMKGEIKEINEDIIIDKNLRWNNHVDYLTKKMNEDGSMNMDIIATLSPPKLKQAILRTIPECDAKSTGITPLYEKIYELMKCFYKKDPSKFFLI